MVRPTIHKADLFRSGIAYATLALAAPSGAMTQAEFAALRVPAETALAPDGTAVAYRLRRFDLDADRVVNEIRIVSLQNGRTRTVAVGTSPSWSADGTQLAVRSETGVAIVDAVSGTSVAVSLTGESVIALRWMPAAPRLGMIVARAGREPRLVVAGYAGKIQSETSLPSSTREFDFHPDGTAIVVTDGSKVELIDLRNGSRRSLASARRAATLAFSPSGRRLLYFDVSDDAAGPMQPIVIELDTGGSRRLGDGFENWMLRYPAPFAAWRRDEAAIIVGLPERLGLRIYELALGSGGMRPLNPERTAPYWISFDRRQRSLAFVASQSHAPPEVFVTRLDRFAPNPVSRENPDPPSMASATPVQWTSRDGLPVEGLLMRPPQHTAGLLPLVVIVEGSFGTFDLTFSGREIADNGALFPLQQQLFAARGWAVLMPNPRGSWGYGSRFAAAARGDWGIGPSDDILAGVRKLVDDRVVDPKRVAIAGLWIDAYRAALAATREPVFRSMVLIDGMMDLSAWYGQDEQSGHQYIERVIGGTPWSAPDLYRELSPWANLSRLRTPTLCVATEPSPQWIAVQAMQFCNGLASQGVRATYVPPSGKGLSDLRPKELFSLHERITEWIAHDFAAANDPAVR